MFHLRSLKLTFLVLVLFAGIAGAQPRKALWLELDTFANSSNLINELIEQEINHLFLSVQANKLNGSGFSKDLNNNGQLDKIDGENAWAEFSPLGYAVDLNGDGDMTDRLIPPALPSGFSEASLGVDLDCDGKLKSFITTAINEEGPCTLYDARYENELASFIALAKRHKIEVHAMVLEDPGFSLAQEHSGALLTIRNIISFNQKHPDSSFFGLHIDTEPHKLELWKKRPGDDAPQTWEGRELLMQDYVLLLSQIRSYLNDFESRLEFSGAIAWWYNERAQRGTLPSGSATVLSSYLDVLVPMVYFDTQVNDLSFAETTIFNRSIDELQSANTIIGINLDEFKSYSPATLEQFIKNLNRRYETQTTYKGISLFSLENF
ncbi:MAG: hypothetical protein KC422_16855 [Trueperaceae bacterium]|nr:hypothetical protein [Trueperaceae bacterium]